MTSNSEFEKLLLVVAECDDEWHRCNCSVPPKKVPKRLSAALKRLCGAYEEVIGGLPMGSQIEQEEN